ncbi:MAG: hypothetical protein LAP38_01010 [Acidobacteriia bacterium]|nr:hypothetical protein [Terriglobia bacterium]
MGTTAKIIVAIAIITGLIVGVSYKVYFIRENSVGYVMWNPREAFFFIHTGKDGLYVSGLGYPWYKFKQYLGGFAAVELPDDQRVSLVVFRVTPIGVEHHMVRVDRGAHGGPGRDADKYTPLDDRIYAYCPEVIGSFMQDGHLVAKDPNDGLCRWTGDHFEKATEEERQRLGGVSRLTMGDFENNEDGWSRRAFGAEQMDRRFTIDMGDKCRLAVNNVVTRPGNSSITIDLLLPGKTPERIGVFEAREGRVSKSEYQHTFQSPSGD